MTNRVKHLENVFFYYYLEGQAVKMAKMKETVFLNSRLKCEYVKNKAALFALQDHSSRNMYNTKGKK